MTVSFYLQSVYGGFSFHFFNFVAQRSLDTISVVIVSRRGTLGCVSEPTHHHLAATSEEQNCASCRAIIMQTIRSVICSHFRKSALREATE